MHVAVVDSGPLGGTCLNRGCIPSKVLLYPADVIRTLQEASRIGVHATLDRVDYDLIVKRMWKIVLDGRHEMERGVAHSDEIDFYNDVGSFVSDYTLQVGSKKDPLQADRHRLGRAALHPAHRGPERDRLSDQRDPL